MRIPGEAFGCFGKLPVSREFLVTEAAVLSESGFDNWIGEGLGLAKINLGSDRFRDRVGAFRPQRFVWSPPGGTRAAVGVMVPSEDGAGRLHPFAVYAWVERAESAADDPAHALRMLALHGRLDELVTECRQATDASSLLRHVRAVTFEGSTTSATEDYATYLGAQSVGAFFSAVSAGGTFAAPKLGHQVLQALIESVEFLRGRSPIDIRLGLRCPLAPGPASTAQVAVWIEWIRSLFQAAIAAPCYFWTHPGSVQEGEGSHLHFFFSRPSAAQWTSLVDPEADLETVSALERPYGGDPAERMSATLREALDSPDTPLSVLRNRLGG